MIHLTKITLALIATATAFALVTTTASAANENACEHTQAPEHASEKAKEHANEHAAVLCETDNGGGETN